MSTVEGYVYFGALVMLVAFGAAALMKRSRTLLLPGIAVFWTLLGTALAFFAPGLGYVFIWTAIAGTILLLAPNSILVRVGVVLAVAVVHVPWIDFLLQFSMPRPGNPDSQLLPLGGAAIAFAALSLLVVKEAVGAYERTR